MVLERGGGRTQVKALVQAFHVIECRDADARALRSFEDVGSFMWVFSVQGSRSNAVLRRWTLSPLQR